MIRTHGGTVYNHNDILFDRYIVERFLSKGGFGEVYLVRQINLEVFRAVKCIRKCSAGEELARKEADILKNLNHPGIPTVIDVEENSEYIFIIEEFVEGESLQQLISKKVHFSKKTVLDYAIKLCEIVEYLHKQGIFHEDIKPTNILVTDGQIKLVDYGNAIRKDLESPVAATQYYSPPEVYEGKKDERTDVYGIGTVILYMMEGSLNVGKLSDIAPQELSKIVSKCLSHQEKERYADVRELKKELLCCIKKNVSVSEQKVNIAFFGAYRHAGTTHLSIAAAKYLTERKHCGKRVILMECNESGDFIKLLGETKRLRFDSGIYCTSGLRVVPNYRDYVETDLKDGEIIVRDYGEITREKMQEAANCEYICICTGTKTYELDTLGEIFPILKDYKGKVTILFNFADAKSFKKAVKACGPYKPVRAPYSPEISMD